jgi:hypothetical protein
MNKLKCYESISTKSLRLAFIYEQSLYILQKSCAILERSETCRDVDSWLTERNRALGDVKLSSSGKV